jgi:hypothetical protein
VKRKQDSTEDENEWFENWTWGVAPKGHSNDEQRRFMWLTFTDAYKVRKYIFKIRLLI